MKKIHDSYAKLVELKWMGRALTLREALMRPGAGLAPAPARTRLSGRRCWRPLGLGRASGAGAGATLELGQRWSSGVGGGAGAHWPWAGMGGRRRPLDLQLAPTGLGRASALAPTGTHWHPLDLGGPRR